MFTEPKEQNMAQQFPFSAQTMLDAIDKGLEAAGYTVKKLGRKTSIITKNGQQMTVAIRTSRDRAIGSPQKGGALHRSDIDAFVIGAVNSVDNPTSVEVYLAPRAKVLKSFEMHNDARRAAGYAVGPGPSFVVLDKRENDPGSGLAEEFRPIAVVAVEPVARTANFKRWDGGVVSQAVSDPAPKVHEHGELRWVDNVDQFKEEVAASAERWFGSHKAKIDIHIVIDV
jgi:hypothetical protein